MLNGPKPPFEVLSIARSILYWILVLGVAAFVFVYFVRTSGVNGLQPASIDKLLTGTAPKPYILRVLLPTVAKTVSPLLNAETSLSIGVQAETILGNRVFRRDLDGKRHPSEVLLILAMMYLSLIGFVISVWNLLLDLGYPPILRQAVPVLLLLGSMLFMQYGYIYDFTTLFLFSLGCLLMQRRQWIGYLFVFACATLNKETAIFLCVIFGLSFLRRMPRRKFILLVGSQLVVYGLLQGAIRYAFRDSPGRILPDGLPGQMLALHDLVFHKPVLLLCSILWLLIMAALILYRWSDKPVILRTAPAVLVFLLGLYLVGGVPSEIRVFLEVYPMMALLMLPPPWTDIAPGAGLDSETAPEPAS